MKIGIVGTRGIPNQYGGFEQFAEYLSAGLVERGHQVWVYNSHRHSYQESTWKGVNIVHCYDPEHKLGTAGQFIYDFNCIRDSRKRDLDIVLQLGYTSSSVWTWLFNRKQVLITNMDGLEWKRSKYNKWTQRFLQRAERWAARGSDILVADSEGIEEYILQKYARPSHFIPYGANIPSIEKQDFVREMNLSLFGYDMIIARLEPENNIEMILTGFTLSNIKQPILVVGNHNTSYGNYLKNKFAHNHIRFVGAIYDISKLDELRHYARYYFHGHSVGGTNPSLLEAMASGALVCVHENRFNCSVIGEGGLFFKSAVDVAAIMDQDLPHKKREALIATSLDRIDRFYSWKRIIDLYESLFIKSKVK
ncbi:MAG: DUF1972 domain-containing protein [Flavobacteriales bacterium]